MLIADCEQVSVMSESGFNTHTRGSPSLSNLQVKSRQFTDGVIDFLHAGEGRAGAIRVKHFDDSRIQEGVAYPSFS